MSRTEAANFDVLARIYGLLEVVSFGGALSRRRMCFLDDPCFAPARSVLVLGDGDGRFTAELIERYPSLEVTAVDASAAMLAMLQRRVARRSPQASLAVHRADAREWSPPPQRSYDIVVSHFFFDCFTTADVSALIHRISCALAPNARWLVSEFAVPPQKKRAVFARFVIRALYFAFWLSTGLRVKTLPDHAGPLTSAGFAPVRIELGVGGMLRSELWLMRQREA